MKHLFLDTNILIDFISKRLPHYKNAEKIFSEAVEGNICLYTSSLSVANCFYILKSQYKEQVNITELKSDFKKLLKIIKITDMTGDNVHSALDSDFKDFEDALQNFSAENHADISIIITRDEKDFATSSLLVQTPQQFLETNNFN